MCAFMWLMVDIGLHWVDNMDVDWLLTYVAFKWISEASI